MVVSIKVKSGADAPVVCSIKVRINLENIKQVLYSIYQHAVKNAVNVVLMWVDERFQPFPYIM